MTTLWTAQDAAVATGGKAHGDWVANGVSIDTRTIQAGELFVALKTCVTVMILWPWRWTKGPLPPWSHTALTV